MPNATAMQIQPARMCAIRSPIPAATGPEWHTTSHNGGKLGLQSVETLLSWRLGCQSRGALGRPRIRPWPNLRKAWRKSRQNSTQFASNGRIRTNEILPSPIGCGTDSTDCAVMPTAHGAAPNTLAALAAASNMFLYVKPAKRHCPEIAVSISSTLQRRRNAFRQKPLGGLGCQGWDAVVGLGGVEPGGSTERGTDERRA